MKMQALALAAVLIHFCCGRSLESNDYDQAVEDVPTKCPVSLVFSPNTGKKSFYPEYEGRVFIPLIGEPYKDKLKAESECKLLNGEPANIYTTEHLQDIIKFIKNDKRLGKLAEDHGGKIDMRLGMIYEVRARSHQALRFRDGSEGPYRLQGNWIYGSRSISQLQKTPRRSVILRIKRPGKFQKKFLYREKPTEGVLGVLCEVETNNASSMQQTNDRGTSQSNGRGMSQSKAYIGPLGIPIMKSPPK